jgi:hypothetical protein
MKRLIDMSSVSNTEGNVLIDKDKLKDEAIKSIKEILSRHKEIDIADIKLIGLVDTGEFQFKVPRDIMYRQVITLLAYLMWFNNISEEEIKNG